MGANRLAAVSAAKRAPSPSIWATSPRGQTAVSASRTGILDVFDLSTGARSTLPPARLPVEAGAPTAVVLRPHKTPSTYPQTVVSTSSGTILLDAVEITSLGSPAVTALAYHQSLIAAAGGSENVLVLVDPETRRVTNRFPLTSHHTVTPSRLTIAEDGLSVLVCSQAITQMCISTGSILKRFSSSLSLPTAAISLQGSTSRFVTGNSSRYISLWDGSSHPKSQSGPSAETPAKRRRSSAGQDHENATASSESPTAPTIVLQTPDAAPVSMLCASSTSQTLVTVMSLHRGGPVAIWYNVDTEPPKRATKPVPASFTVRPPGPGVTLHVATLSKKRTLSVLYGNVLKPTAHTVSLADIHKKGLSLPFVDDNVIMSGADVSVIGAREQAKLDLVERSTALQVANTPAPVKRKNGITHAGNDAARDESCNDEEPRNIASLVEKERKNYSENHLVEMSEEKSDEGDVDDEDDGELTIQEELMGLGISPSSSGQDKSSIPTLETTLRDSRVNVLTQAVRSKNMQLLDDCLRKTKGRSAITNTVKELPPEMAVGAFLDFLVARVEMFPARADFIVAWIRAILIEHASTLVTQNRDDALLSLNALIESRTRSLDALARLEGRLELVVGQAQRVQRSNFGVDLSPVAEFVEIADESEDDGMESDRSEDALDAEDMDEEIVDGTNEVNGAKLSETTLDGESSEDSEDSVEINGELLEVQTGHAHGRYGGGLAQASGRKAPNGIAGKKRAQESDSDEDSDASDDDDDDSGDDDEEHSDAGDKMDVVIPAEEKRKTSIGRPIQERNGVQASRKAKKDVKRKSADVRYPETT